MIDNEILLEFTNTKKEKEVITLLSQGFSNSEVAKKLQISRNAVSKRKRRVLDRASLRGYSPEHDMTHTTPETHLVKGTSTLYRNGNPVMQWVKTGLNMEKVSEILHEMVEGMKDDLTPIEEIPASDVEFETDVIPWLNIGDAHVNMLAHVNEVNHGFNLKTVEIELCKAINMLIGSMPNYERVVINDLGDFTHMENFEGFTHASKNLLDKDGTFPQMVRTAVRIMRFIVESCLKKFKFVEVVINQGNHSRTNDIWMSELIRNVYADNPRLHVLDNSNVFIPYRMGNTFVMTHHGDKCKASTLANVMAADYPKDFGDSKFRYIYTGHVHHSNQRIEGNGVVVESFNTLAPHDKYAHDHGYRSQSAITAVLLSKTYGEIGRHRVPVEMVQDFMLKEHGSDKNVFELKTNKVYTV